ncbi:MAG: c-type cytochrome [Vicinamibacterales bacterium]
MRIAAGAVLLVVGLLIPAGAHAQSAAEPVGDPANGKVTYAFGNTSCSNCHGREGEGGFGPALAGRNLAHKQFYDAIRNPVGRMPTFNEANLKDQEIADMRAYLNGLPSGAKPGAWRVPMPTGPMPQGQMLAHTVIGCVMCHGATFETPRHGMAEVNGDFEWFKKMVYDHTTAQAEQWKMLDPSIPRSTPTASGPWGRIRMGNYSPSRLPEPMLKEIFTWISDLGALVPLLGRVSDGQKGTGGVTYTVKVINAGVKDKGLVAEGVTVALALPADTTVVSATGTGYEGVKHDEDAKGNAAIWRLPRVGPTETQTLTVTLSGNGAATTPKGKIRWDKPAVKADPDVDILPERRGAPGA